MAYPLPFKSHHLLLGLGFLGVLGLAACLSASADTRPGPPFVKASPGHWAEPMSPRFQTTLATTFEAARAIPGSTALTVAIRTATAGQWQASTPNDDARFWWASCGKLVTAMLALQEVEAGRLEMDVPVRQYLDYVPSGVTLRHLLTHTSGIADFSNPDVLDGKFGPVDDRHDIVQTALALGPTFEPGRGWAYSNTGFLIIQDLLETINGQSMAQLVQSRIANPLGLDRFAALDQRHPADVILPDLGDPRPASEFPSNIGGAGNIVATASDMARFWQAGMSGEFVSRETTAAMIATVHPMFGEDVMLMGTGVIVFPASDGSGYWLGHGGGADQVGALVLYSPARQMVIAIAGIGPEVHAMEIANLFIETIDRCEEGKC